MEDYTEFKRIVEAIANNQDFIDASAEIANHFQVPTQLVFDEAGIHVRVGQTLIPDKPLKLTLLDEIDRF